MFRVWRVGGLKLEGLFAAFRLMGFGAFGICRFGHFRLRAFEEFRRFKVRDLCLGFRV